MFDLHSKAVMPTPETALPGRETSMSVPDSHAVLKTPLKPPFPDYLDTVVFGLGCFWGAERKFWSKEGVFSTAVGYSAGYTPNPTYEEVCSGLTGHNEVVLVVFDPVKVTFDELLKLFWESHNPTQGMRQGNDRGTQYRSGIYCSDKAQLEIALTSRENYQQRLASKMTDAITTEIQLASDFFYAEPYHQQYLHKNPNGYCGLRGTGVTYKSQV